MITNEAKNNVSLTNEEMKGTLTWDESTMTWDESTGTWDVPGDPITKESKNSVSLTNESI